MTGLPTLPPCTGYCGNCHLWQPAHPSSVLCPFGKRCVNSTPPTRHKPTTGPHPLEAHSQARRLTATITTEKPQSSQMSEERFCEIRPSEPCVLVGVQLTTVNPDKTHMQKRIFDLTSSLAELQKLAETTGIHVVNTLTQTLPTPDAATYIRSGKVGELKSLLDSSNV